MNTKNPSWRQTAQVFAERAAEYDSWFDHDNPIFATELQAIKEITIPLAGPRLEVGVGSGRFAEALGVEFGLDPALASLELAAPRLDSICQGVGEALPLRDECMATVYLLFTLCFLPEPEKVLAEIHRVLQPGGYLVLGMIPADGPWGEYLQAKKDKDHPFYRHARFYEVRQIIQWLVGMGFEAREIRASLFQAPDEMVEVEHSRKGLVEDCGFAIFVVKKIMNS